MSEIEKAHAVPERKGAGVRQQHSFNPMKQDTLGKRLLGLLVLTAAASAFAAPPPPFQALVAAATNGQGQVVKSFKGPDPNIEGIVVHLANGQRVVGWVVDGKYLAAGSLFDTKGQNLTVRSAQDIGLAPKPAAASDVARKAVKAAGFEIGAKGPLLIEFADPNCIWCHKLYGALKPLIVDGKVRVRIIPVGVIKPSSVAKAVAVMDSAHPQLAWALNQSKFNTSDEEGGIQPADLTKSGPMVASIEANNALMQSSGSTATPTLVYCNSKRQVQVLATGILPTQVPAFVASLSPMSGQGTCAQ